MKHPVDAWVAKAEGDFSVAEHEWKRRKNRNFDAICFHIQQCLEKYLKARLEKESKSIPRTHDLAMLVKRCETFEPLWSSYRTPFERLSSFAVQSRYPGLRCDLEDATTAIKACRQARKVFRAGLGLKNR